MFSYLRLWGKGIRTIFFLNFITIPLGESNYDCLLQLSLGREKAERLKGALGSRESEAAQEEILRLQNEIKVKMKINQLQSTKVSWHICIIITILLLWQHFCFALIHCLLSPLHLLQLFSLTNIRKHNHHYTALAYEITIQKSWHSDSRLHSSEYCLCLYSSP